MIIEYIRYQVPASRHADFLAAYGSAAHELESSPHCLAWEISQGVEEPDNFVVRIEWTSQEDHEQGFRRGASFGAFFAKVKPFFADIREMKHYRAHHVAKGAARS